MTLPFAKKMSQIAPTTSLKYLLHHNLGGIQPARPIHNVHASALTKPTEEFCPREYALYDVTKFKLKPEYLGAADVITFDMGNDLQGRIVHHFADMGRAIGHWKCQGCGHLHEFCKRPVECAMCGCKAFRAEEVRFISDYSGASCGIDCLIEMTGKLLPIEIKTMKKEEFEKLTAPLAEHRLRTSLYLRIIAESKQLWAQKVNTNEARVLYVCKAGYISDPELKKWGLTDKFSPFKEFTLSRKDDVTVTPSERAKVVKQFRAGEVGMPCGICATGMVKRAQTCRMKNACFSGDHPPEHDWK